MYQIVNCRAFLWAPIKPHTVAIRLRDPFNEKVSKCILHGHCHIVGTCSIQVRYILLAIYSTAEKSKSGQRPSPKSHHTSHMYTIDNLGLCSSTSVYLLFERFGTWTRERCERLTLMWRMPHGEVQQPQWGSFVFAINVTRQLHLEKKPIMKMGSNESSAWEFIWSWRRLDRLRTNSGTLSSYQATLRLDGTSYNPILPGSRNWNGRSPVSDSLHLPLLWRAIVA